MPYKSKAQQRKFHAMQARGEMPPGTVKKWDSATTASKGGFKSLPERAVKKAAGKAAKFGR